MAKRIIKIKPVQPSEIKDPDIVREVIAEIRREHSLEEWAVIEARRKARQELLKRAMAH